MFQKGKTEGDMFSEHIQKKLISLLNPDIKAVKTCMEKSLVTQAAEVKNNSVESPPDQLN